MIMKHWWIPMSCLWLMIGFGIDTLPINTGYLCPPFSKPDHGQMVPNSYPGEMEKAMLLCDKGFTHNGSKELECVGNVWKGTIGICRAYKWCPPLDEAVSLSEREVGDLVYMPCPPGQWYNGTNPRVCQENETWSGVTGQCQGYVCDLPPELKHGRLMPVSLTERNLVMKVVCNEGYTHNGSEELVCLEQRKWRGTLGQCKETGVNCPKPQLDTHVIIDNETYATDMIVSLSCGEGYIFSGTQNATCKKNGEWTDISASCKAIQCNELPHITNGRVNITGRSYNSTGLLQCDEGYEVNGPSTTRCLDTERWSPIGQCTREKPEHSAVVSGVIVTVLAVGFLGFAAFIIREKASTFDVLNATIRQIVEELFIEAKRVKVQHIIGQGHHGLVYRGTLKKQRIPGDDQQVALKTLKGCPFCDSDELNNSFLEATRLRSFDHPNVLPLLGVTEIGNQFYVIMAGMEVGGLKTYIQSQPIFQELYIKFLHDAAKGLQYLEEMNFIHRDIAARNCMLDKGMKLLISDFGLSRDWDWDYYTPDDTTKKIPLRWMAPESLDNFTYSTKSDVWSYGVLMWEVFSKGATPYIHVSPGEVLDYLKKGNRLRKPRLCPTALYNLQMDCWDLNPSSRPTFGMLVRSLEDILSNVSDLESISSTSSG